VVPRETSNRATRVAWLGLAIVVVCLAGFSTFAAYSTQTRVEDARRSVSLLATYERAIDAIREEDIAEVEYLVDESPENGARRSAAITSVIAAIDGIAAQDDGEDADLAAGLLILHDRRLLASDELVIAIGMGDRTEARRIELDTIDPIFEAMLQKISTVTNEHAATSGSAFAALDRTASWQRIATPIVFVIGFGLLLGLRRILDQADHARRRTYREIEQLSRLRGEFVSIVSHEFRTPLMGVQGFSELMRDEELTIPEMREYAGDINKDARRLSSLISDMLDLDLMESGRVTLRFEPVDLNRILVEAAAPFSSSAPDHPIELHLAEGLPKVNGESERLSQVVTNLLSNAIKYSPNGAVVEAGTTRDGPMVTLTVRDHGIGIPGEQLEKIFDRYSRIEAGIKGIGLGLAIVSQIVQLHQGTVWATSDAGDGSVFHVRLPLMDSATLAPRTAALRSRVHPA
jgi:signal transduction histidine kinase